MTSTRSLKWLAHWRAALATATFGAAALLAACGGGGDSTPAAGLAPPAAAGAGSYALGAISGFGSVIVGGVRYDDTGAAIADEDGASHSRSELKLGMMVQMDAGTVDRALGAAIARRVIFGNEVLGPVGTVDTVASTVIVLGQKVFVTASTVFDTTLVGGLSALTTGMVVEVHGILDKANDRVVATRIEPKPAATAYRLRGVISALDTTAKSFRIGSELISYAGLGITDVPVASLADGKVVRVALQTAQVNGAWVATRVRAGLRLPDGQRDAHVEGVVTVFTSSASFSVNGLAVDASNATFPDGTTGVVLGARVEVTGVVTNGVLVASKVELEERRDFGRREFELHGDISGLDTTAKTFALRGLTVAYGAVGVTYKGGVEADLANGRRVEVKGVLSADRTRLEARSVSFER